MQFLKSEGGGIRKLMLRDLLGVMILTAGTVLALTLLFGRATKEELLRTIISRTVESARDRIIRFFEPLDRNLELICEWGKAGLLRLEEVDSLNAKFMPALERLPDIAALVLARSDGAEYFLLREENGWLTRSIHVEKGTHRRIVFRRWYNARQPLGAEFEKDIGYDPLQRPWFRNAMESVQEGKVSWSKAYEFFSTKKIGWTGSIRWVSSDDGTLVYVAALDVEAESIFRLLAKLPVSERGRVFIVGSDGGRILTAPASASAGESEEAENGVIAQAVKFLREPGGVSSERPRKFSFGKETWWVGFNELRAADRTVLIGVLVPERDLIGGFWERGTILIPAMLVVIIAGVIAVRFVIQKYVQSATHASMLSVRNMDEPSLLEVIQGGESETVEFKSTLRVNLKTGKPGKEVELAWLKTVVAFMNTRGGVLLIGVGDAG
ncbi:MAG: RNA-binding domain-containing protein, partial [Thermodesulfovibrionales bacterium]